MKIKATKDFTVKHKGYFIKIDKGTKDYDFNINECESIKRHIGNYNVGAEIVGNDESINKNQGKPKVEGNTGSTE